MGKSHHCDEQGVTLMMRSLAGLSACVWLIGCSGPNAGLAGSDEARSDDNLICFGDPDTGTVCTAFGEWDCTEMSDWQLKCQLEHLAAPSGVTGWTCSTDEFGVTCTIESPHAVGGEHWTCEQTAGKEVCSADFGPGGPNPTPATPSGETSSGGPGAAGRSSGAGQWICESDEFRTACRAADERIIPPGGASSWTCELSAEFTMTCTGSPGRPAGGTRPAGGIAPGGDITPEGSGGSGSNVTPPSGSGSAGANAPGSPASPGPVVCNSWYAVKWGIGGSSIGSCEGIPNNAQDCDSIRNVLDAGLPGPVSQGECSVAPVRSGDNWVVTLPPRCEFVHDQSGAAAVCGKYGGNVFLTAAGTNVATLPAQSGTGLSHFELMWCCE